MRRVAIAILVTTGLSAPVLSQNTPVDRAGGAADILNADDVLAVVNIAAYSRLMRENMPASDVRRMSTTA